MDTIEEGKVAKEPFYGKLSDLIHNARKMKTSSMSELEKIFNEHEKVTNHFEAYDKDLKKREKEMEEERRKIDFDLIHYVRKMKTTTVDELEKIFNEHEKLANHLEAYDRDLKKREKELEDRRKINSEKKVSERAILLNTGEAENVLRLADERKIEKRELHSRIAELQKNLADALALAGEQKTEKQELHSRITELQKNLENALRLAGERKRENEDLHRRIVELEKKLDAKQALELALKVPKESFEDGEVRLKDDSDREVELKNKLEAIQKDLKDKEQEIEDQDFLIQALIAKERKSHDELQETDEELINCDASTHGTHIGPSPPLYDYTKHFTTDKVFDTDDALIEWTKSIGEQQGLVIVIKASEKLAKGRRPRMRFACERSGKYRQFVKKSDGIDWVVKKRVRTTGSKKCECPFELKCVQSREGWTVTVFNGIHNHPPAGHMEGHSFARRLSSKHESMVVEMSTSLFKPREILASIKHDEPSNCTTIKTIYNVRAKHRVKELARRSQKQQREEILS